MCSARLPGTTGRCGTCASAQRLDSLVLVAAALWLYTNGGQHRVAAGFAALPQRGLSHNGAILDLSRLPRVSDQARAARRGERFICAGVPRGPRDRPSLIAGAKKGGPQATDIDRRNWETTR